MMLQSFLPDGAVLVNLQDNFIRYNTIHVSAEEEYVTEGSPFIRGIYYDSSIRLAGLKQAELLRLIREGWRLARDGFQIPVAERENLSPEGRIFVEACDLAPQTCNQMLDEMNGLVPPWQCVADGWASFVVHEVSYSNLSLL